MSEDCEWFEIWILVALLMAAKGRGTTVSLTGLIATADAINHAIITRDELEVGLSRLIEAGYVVESPKGFRATRRSTSMWSKSAAKRSYVHTAWRDVTEAVGERAGPRDPPKTARQRLVSKTKYALALKEYRILWARAA